MVEGNQRKGREANLPFLQVDTELTTIQLACTCVSFCNSFDYRDLLSEFHSILTEENISKPVLILIDGADLITDGKAQLASDWIPLQIPKVRGKLVRQTGDKVYEKLNLFLFPGCLFGN